MEGEMDYGKQKTHETWEYVNKLLRNTKTFVFILWWYQCCPAWKMWGWTNGVECITEEERWELLKTLINNQTCFKSTLKRFLYHDSFYSINEYCEYKEDINLKRLILWYIILTLLIWYDTGDNTDLVVIVLKI